MSSETSEDGFIEQVARAIDVGGGQSCDVPGVLRELELAGFVIVRRIVTDDKVLSGPPLDGAELVARLERRMGSLKLVGERDDLLLDSAVFIARAVKPSTPSTGEQHL